MCALVTGVQTCALPISRRPAPGSRRVRFPFARGVTQALVGERLDTVPALQRETQHFWNWLGEQPTGKAKSNGRSEERRVGKEVVRKLRFRGTPAAYKKK